MTSNNKKNTPSSPPSTEEKKGVNSVKDPDGGLTQLCEICGGNHPIYDDGFDYLDCMNWYKKQKRKNKDGKNKK